MREEDLDQEREKAAAVAAADLEILQQMVQAHNPAALLEGLVAMAV